MTICLYDPQFGYYTTREPIGSKGDFITAPEISQMFGEMIGIWISQAWQELGQPSQFNLIELGPGRGTLMKDALRVLAKNPRLCTGLKLRMVETNPHFKAMQAEVVKNYDCEWFDGINDAIAASTNAPIILFANEFLDCLPIKQFLRSENIWQEIKIIIDVRGNLNFAAFDGMQLPPKLAATDAPLGTIFEIAPALPTTIAAISHALQANSGMALFIDYGHFSDETGDSLQALYRHEKISPLSHIGEADLTAHVDFGAVADCAQDHQIEIRGQKTQREFLNEMGIEVRAQALCTANPALEAEIMNDLSRLIDGSQMGDLFKAIILKSTKDE